MTNFYALLSILIGFIFLIKGADLFVSKASVIAEKYKIPSFVIGLTIVAFGTSMPELAVSAMASLNHENAITIGNVLGSNIFNILIVAGVSAIIIPLKIPQELRKRDFPISIFLTLILILMMITNSNISRLEGIILCIVFLFILIVQIKKGSCQNLNSSTATTSNNTNMLKTYILLSVGIFIIILGGQLAVDGATSIAQNLGISDQIIALTIVAVGTSLPELITSIVAAKKNENGIALGNILGSNIFNLTCILGVSSVIYPLTIDLYSIFDALILFFISITVLIFCKNKILKKSHGIILCIFYLIYMIYILLR